MTKQTKQLTVVDEQGAQPVGMTMTSETMAIVLADEGKKRTLIQKYIQENLIEGTDWGKIRIGGRDSKPCLFKPGSEKVCSLLHLRPVFSVDRDLIPIVGEGVIPYVCQLINRHTEAVEGEGRGACSIKEKQGNPNVAIKIAQKRAQLDAVLRVAALSDQFTQDLEDMDHSEPARPSQPAPQQAPRQTAQAPAPAALDSSKYCPFGKHKGKAWASFNEDSLTWYKDYFTKQVNDPSKSQYFEQNEAAYNAVEGEILSRQSQKRLSRDIPAFDEMGDIPF